MDYLTFFVPALLGVPALALLWFVVVIIARSICTLGKLATRSSKNSDDYGRTAMRISYVALFAMFALQAYNAIYPTDDFYLGEFEAATARKPPKDSKVITKHATYPDFHGDYCSFSRIELHEASFRKLLDDLRLDSRFIALPDGDISDGNIPDVKLPLRVVNAFVRNDAEPDYRRTISFLENGTLIEAHVCVT